jgi:hypothetical protein
LITDLLDKRYDFLLWIRSLTKRRILIKLVNPKSINLLLVLGRIVLLFPSVSSPTVAISSEGFLVILQPFVHPVLELYAAVVQVSKPV